MKSRQLTVEVDLEAEAFVEWADKELKPTEGVDYDGSVLDLLDNADPAQEQKLIDKYAQVRRRLMHKLPLGAGVEAAFQIGIMFMAFVTRRFQIRSTKRFMEHSTELAEEMARDLAEEPPPALPPMPVPPEPPAEAYTGGDDPVQDVFLDLLLYADQDALLKGLQELVDKLREEGSYPHGKVQERGPEAADCPNRGTPKQRDCALEGCGFCLAAEVGGGGVGQA